MLGRFPVTVGLLALLACIFGIEELQGGSTRTLVLLRMGANYPPLVFEGQWWRLVTSTLLHIGVVHLLMNGWALWQLGRLAEITFGGAATLSLFVFTGIAGSLLTLLSVKVSAGASGAVFGIEGALLAFFLRHRDRLTPAGKQLLQQLLVWSVLMLVYGFVVPGIDWLGHLGGLLGGISVGWALPPAERTRRPLARGVAAVAGSILIAAVGASVRAERFVVRQSETLGIAVEAPASWPLFVEEGELVVRDSLAALGSAAFVSVALDVAGSPEEALDRVLEAAAPADGLTLGGSARELAGGWLQRTFVWRMEGLELAGFAQARCGEEECLVALAGARGELWGDYRPVLERIASSATRAVATGRP